MMNEEPTKIDNFTKQIPKAPCCLRKTQRASDTNNHKNNGRNHCELQSLENLFSRECLKLGSLKTLA